jgi:signal transduction histidine kinase
VPHLLTSLLGGRHGCHDEFGVRVPSRRTASWLAWAAVGATALLSLAAVVLSARSGPPTGVFQNPQGTSPGIAFLIGTGLLVYPVIGALIASRKPENAIGWLFCAIGVVFSLTIAGATYAFHALDSNPGSLPFGAGVEVLFADGLWLPTLAISTVFLALYFPSGRLHGRGERIVARTAVIALVISGPLATLTERSIYPAPQIRNPFPTRMRSQAVFDTLAVTGLFLLVVCIVASVVFLIKRFRRSRGEEREQFKWFLFSGAFVLITLIPSSLFSSPPAALQTASLIALLTLPVAVAVAILKYRLFDIDVVIRKTIVYGILAGLLAVTGAVAVLAIGAIATGSVRENRIALLAAGVVMGLAIWPLRGFAARISDRVVFGGRRTPYEILTSFAGRVGETYSSEDVLPRMAQVLATATGAERSIVWLGNGEAPRAAAIWPPGGVAPPAPPSDSIEVRHQGEVLGALSVELPANDPMSPAKAALIRDLASQSGPVLRNVRLVEELRDSRRRIVTAQDERARKLERDIHDGAQQQLVALQVQLKLARNMFDREPTKVALMLEGLQEGAQSALEDLRDLARGIYPPLLADKGLPVALEAQARKSPVRVKLASDGIGRFRQEIEAAVYFSCLEALQNVAKYSGAENATITLEEAADELRFEVADDGDGFDPRRSAYGTGLQGIADRLAALGGELTVRSAPGDGTAVAGRLPIKRADP